MFETEIVNPNNITIQCCVYAFDLVKDYF